MRETSAGSGLLGRESSSCRASVNRRSNATCSRPATTPESPFCLRSRLHARNRDEVAEPSGRFSPGESGTGGKSTSTIHFFAESGRSAPTLSLLASPGPLLALFLSEPAPRFLRSRRATTISTIDGSLSFRRESTPSSLPAIIVTIPSTLRFLFAPGEHFCSGRIFVSSRRTRGTYFTPRSPAEPRWFKCGGAPSRHRDLFCGVDRLGFLSCGDCQTSTTEIS